MEHRSSLFLLNHISFKEHFEMLYNIANFWTDTYDILLLKIMKVQNFFYEGPTLGHTSLPRT